MDTESTKNDSPPAAGNCTILLPTYNRHALLRQQISFLAEHLFDFPVEVLDSSEDPIIDQNRKLISEHGFAKHRTYPKDISVFRKFAHGIKGVNTPTCVLLADDDLIIPSAVPELVKAILSNNKCVAAHGLYFEFHKSSNDVFLTGLIQTGKSIDGSTATDRVLQLMGNYEAITYAVVRTSAAVTAFEIAADQRSILAQELLAGTALVAQGTVKRLTKLTHGRRRSSTLGYQNWHPLEWIANDPAGLAQLYACYREGLVPVVISHQPSMAKSELERRVDIAHLVYLSGYLDSEMPKTIAQRDLTHEVTDFEELWDLYASAVVAGWKKPLRGGGRLGRSLRHWFRKKDLGLSIDMLRSKIGGQVKRFSPRYPQAIGSVQIRQNLIDEAKALGCELGNEELQNLSDLVAAHEHDGNEKV